MEWRIGCSGYHYPEWKGLFYPPDLSQRKWFEYYCENFNTLELNATYYKFPRLEVLKKWYTRSPKDFCFTIKAPRHITHFKKFRDARRMLSDFNETARAALAEKLGCVLYQFPSQFQYQPERLSRIVDLLDTAVNNVLEFRHESWWNPEVYETLTTAGITFCGMSHPNLPETVVGTTDTLYYRMHGVPHLYNSGYEVSKLEQIAHELLSHRNSRQAFVQFNNTAEGHAVLNAQQLQDICELVH